MIKRKHWRIRFDSLNVPFGQYMVYRYFDAWQYEKGGPIQALSPSYSSSMTSNANVEILFTDYGRAAGNYNVQVNATPIGQSIFFDFLVPGTISCFHYYTTSAGQFGASGPHISGITVFSRESPDDEWEEIWSDQKETVEHNAVSPIVFQSPNPEVAPVDLSLVLSAGDVLLSYCAADALTGGLPSVADGLVDEIPNAFTDPTTHSATQANPALMPTYKTAGINGRPYLELDGARWLDFAITYPIGVANFTTEINVFAGEFVRVGANSNSYVVGSTANNGGKARLALVYNESGVGVSANKVQFLSPDLPAESTTFGTQSTLSQMTYRVTDGEELLQTGAVSSGTNMTTTALSAARLFASGAGTLGLAGHFYGLLKIRGTSRVPDLVRAVAWAEARFMGYGTETKPAVEIFGLPGGLLVYGGDADVLVIGGPVYPSSGDLFITGSTASVSVAAGLYPLAEQLSIEGGSPTVFVGVSLRPSPETLRIEGFEPGVYTVVGTLASQISAQALGDIPSTALLSQIPALALGEATRDVRSSQIPALALAKVQPPVKVSQVVVYALGVGSPCVTQRCQLWTIRRRDGQVFRFTSHDEEVRRGKIVYLPCKSLNATASENASTLGAVGNIELSGIIDHDSITEADLYGGLFDDAFVTVDLYSWGDVRVAPRRLAAGWTGSISTGDTGFSLEILGPGSRLEQQALVQMITPSCRWVFGSPQCGVNVEAMKVSAKVVKAFSRGALTIDLPAEPSGRQWANGRIRFLTGPNAGQTVETKTVDFASGAVVLWQSPGFLAEPGDDVEILPGCDFNRDGGCSVYNNVINFGGFPDVPGADSLLETPDAKY